MRICRVESLELIMASTKEYLDFVLEQLSPLDGITCREMMGEYLIYKDGVYFGGVFDDRFLVKIADGCDFDFEKQLPYDGAKPMYLVEDIDDKDAVCKIALEVCEALKAQSGKKTKKSK